jgi:hypothetical protein
MNKAVVFTLGAAIGGVIGSVVTWKIIEQKYKKIADDEIESVIEHFKNKEEKEEIEQFANDNDDHVVAYNTDSEITINKDYHTIIEASGYSNDEEDDDEDYTVTVDNGDDYITPFVISPEEFGEKDGYDTKTWMYYADNVLTDELGDIVSEAENIIGDGLSHFGEFEDGDDCVYVRNDNIECDYEILKHEKTYSDINGENY